MSRRVLVGLVLAVACGPTSSPTTSGARRIVSQVVFADEELLQLGDDVRARVVGVSSLADDGRYSGAAARWPAGVPRVAGVEAIVALAPDLVVIAEFTAPETRAQLADLGIVTLELTGWNGFDDYRRHVAELAGAVQASEAGRERVAAFDARLAALRERFVTATPPGVVSWQEGVVAGGGTIFADELGAAGFRDVAAAQGVSGHATIALERLLAWDPEYVVIPCEHGCAATERSFAARPGLASTRAAREGHVIAIEAPLLYSTGAGMLDAVEQLGSRRSPGGDAPP